MAFSSSCFCHFPISHKLQRNQAAPFAHGPKNSILSSQQFGGWNFLEGSRIIRSPNVPKTLMQRRSSRVSASLLESSEVATSLFPVASAAVIPFYVFMVVAPKAKLLDGVAKMFSKEMTVASAWVHVLAMDLYVARKIYRDGLKNDIETRHSVPLALLCCPIGLITHFITKKLKSSILQERLEK